MKQEIPMLASTQISRSTQRTVCMLMSAAIVSVMLLVGALAAQPALHDGYSVTVTQLQ
jgi:hypothetical protein